ncbi:MAG: hypothetical protein ACQPRH_01465 [Solitalea-like symbiont of Tyrophagus putrescentiae]
MFTKNIKTGLVKSIVLGAFVSITFIMQGCCIMGCYPVVNKIVAADQKLTVQHNYMAITAKDSAQVDIEVSYAVLDNDTNKTVVKKLKTPCLIGGEDVMIHYDVIETTKNGKYLYTSCKVKRDSVYKQAGDITIKNLSDKPLEYAVMNNIPIRFLSKKQLAVHKFANADIIKDSTKVFTAADNIRIGPIYKWTPIIYLIKPELAPNIVCYAGEIFVGGSHKKIYVKEIPLKNPHFGEAIITNPYSIEQMMELYRDKQNELFETYDEQYKSSSIAKDDNRLYRYYGIIEGNGYYVNPDEDTWININLSQPVANCPQ